MYASFLCHFCQPDGGSVVDVVGEIGVEVSERIVGQVGEMNDRIETIQLIGGHQSGVELGPRRAAVDAVVEPTDPVKAGVVAHDVVAGVHQTLAQQCSDVALATGE